MNTGRPVRPLSRDGPAKLGRRGQSMVEFALVFPIFMVILLGIFEFGRLMLEFSSLANAAREGARVGIIATATESQIRDAAQTTAVTVGPPAVTIRAFRGGTQLADVSSRTSGDIIEVRVAHTFEPVALSGSGVPAQVPLAGSARMRVE